jgi:hypothetical protein
MAAAANEADSMSPNGIAALPARAVSATIQSA